MNAACHFRMLFLVLSDLSAFKPIRYLLMVISARGLSSAVIPVIPISIFILSAKSFQVSSPDIRISFPLRYPIEGKKAHSLKTLGDKRYVVRAPWRNVDFRPGRDAKYQNICESDV